MNIRIKNLLAYLPIITLSGCVSLSLVSPSFNYNNNYSGGNPNQITCDTGGFFSYPVCSIPISRFVALTAQYADPLESDAMVVYAMRNNNAFIFNDLVKTSVIESLNKGMFAGKYITNDATITFPPYLDELNEKLTNEYQPENNYISEADTYIYKFTLNAIHFAITPCIDVSDSISSPYDKEQYQQLFMLYKAFSIQYTNDILRHVGSGYFHFDTKYEDEEDLYNHLYASILKLNPSQLQHLAQAVFQRTNDAHPSFESGFYTDTGVAFGAIGTFSCTAENTSWKKYGSDYFGLNVSGVRILVQFKNRDVFANTDKQKLGIIPN